MQHKLNIFLVYLLNSIDNKFKLCVFVGDLWIYKKL